MLSVAYLYRSRAGLTMICLLTPAQCRPWAQTVCSKHPVTDAALLEGHYADLHAHVEYIEHFYSSHSAHWDLVLLPWFGTKPLLKTGSYWDSTLQQLGQCCHWIGQNQLVHCTMSQGCCKILLRECMTIVTSFHQPRIWVSITSRLQK